MEPFILENKEYFTIGKWQKYSGLVAGFSSKKGGYSQIPFSTLNVGLHVHDQDDIVIQNRQHLAEVLSYPLDQWVCAEQTHEVHIQKLTKESIGKGTLAYEDAFKRTDGFFTFDKQILLTMCYADCVPLYFCHPATGAIGVAHAGWKGTVNGIAKEMLRVFQEEGIDVKEIEVVIGPSICGNCYIVDDRVISSVDHILHDLENKPYILLKDHQYKLDLKEVNREILLKEGILDENIMKSNYCTSCHQEYFFSHRRDQGKTGRMMSFIGWKEDLKFLNESQR